MKAEQERLARAVASWLEYKSLTGLEGLFNEASIAVPIAEFLSSAHGKEIEAEVAHPCFSSGGRGRPKQTDFVRKRNGANTWHSAYECKFQNPSLSSVVADICRLLLLTNSLGIGAPDRYFLVAGKLEGGRLLNRDSNLNGARQDAFKDLLCQDGTLLQRDVSQRKSARFAVRLDGVPDPQLREFKAFSSENRNIELPNVFSTELCGWSQGEEYACGVWKIAQRQGTGTINWLQDSK